mmetsp:Transcript_24306/g.49349  ORF Transcript_24306/g.49349 Transcript_24306/m.49349 type:complete len:293 (-) Transcript_24306:200-1078(-)
MEAPSGLAGVILNVVGCLDDLINVKCASTPTVVQAALSDGKVELLPKDEFGQLLPVIACGMAGTKKSDPEWLLHWLFGPVVKDYDDPHRHDVFKFVLATAVMRRIREAGSHGFMLASRNPSGELAAGGLFRWLPNGPKKESEFLENIRMGRTVFNYLVPRGEMPALLTDPALEEKKNRWKGGVEKRKAHLKSFMDELHAKHAPGAHIYVKSVATNPALQGQGHMSRILRAINRICDAEGLPAYLECSGAKNKGIYEHFGYVCEGVYPIHLEGDEPGWKPNTPLYAMLRPPAA